MMWSEHELANLAAGSAVAVRSRVIKYLGMPENEDVFQNFSLLWGILGNGGTRGIDEKGAYKVWHTLAENGALDAYEKGILADFTALIAKNVTDLRLKPWRGLNNYLAGVLFENLILKPLTEINEELYNLVSTYYINEEKLFHDVVTKGITERFKTYLEKLKNARDGDRLALDRTAILKKLTNEIVYHKNTLKFDDKRYLFLYLKDLVENGCAADDIGFDDAVSAALTADKEFDGASELEETPFLTHNNEIAEFAQSLDEKCGFFEETAAKIILHDTPKTPYFTERCLALIKNGQPRGVVYALALLQLKQIKSAVTVLAELANHGAILEMNGFLHRLLPLSAGAEGVLLNIIKRNLDYLMRNRSFYQEYAVRRTFPAVRDFAENGNLDEACDLLNFIVLNGWLGDEFQTEFINQTNYLLFKDSNLSDKLINSINYMKLNIFEVNGYKYIGVQTDNPLSLARERWQKAVLEATTLDLSKAGNVLKGVESSAYGMLYNIKNKINKNIQKQNDNLENESNRLENKEEEVSSSVTFLDRPSVQLENASLDEPEVLTIPQSNAEKVETPLEVASVDEVPLDEALREVAPLDEAPLDEAPLEVAPLDETPLDEAPLEVADSEDNRPLDAPIPFEEIMPLDVPQEFPDTLPQKQQFTMPDAPFDFDAADEVNADGVISYIPSEEPNEPEKTSAETDVSLPLDEVPLDEAPREVAPLDETPLDEAPCEVASVDEAPLDEAPLEVAPLDETPLDEAPLEVASVDEVPLDDMQTSEPENQSVAEQMPKLFEIPEVILPSQQKKNLEETKLPEIEKWTDDEQPQTSSSPLAHLKNMVKSDEIDKQYAKLKSMTYHVVEKAGDKAQKLTEKVRKKAQSKNGKLSSFLTKIKSIRKPKA